MGITREDIHEISKWLMIIGGSIFTAGAGMNFICNRVERKELKKLQELEDRQIRHENEQLKIEEKQIYNQKLQEMDKDIFAKYHAEQIAKADKKVIEDANRIKRESEAEVLKTKIDCSDEIDRIRRECLEKVEAANAKRDEAVRKYEAIDTLFTNKNEIIKAKESLDKALRKDEKAKEDKEELLKDIKRLIE